MTVLSICMKRKEVSDQLQVEVEDLFQKVQNSIITPDNRMSYQHGTTWRAAYSDNPDRRSNLEEQYFGTDLSLRRIVDHDLGIAEDFFQKLAENLQKVTWTSIYGTLNEAVDGTPNSIDGKQFSSKAEVFKEALKRIEFGVDRFGKPSKPEFHIPPELGKDFIEELESSGQEFRNEIDEIIEEKEKLATYREAQRVSRFELSRF